MTNIFIVSDTHFGHSNILNFTDYEGKKVRSFNDVTDMDEHMIQRWNTVVGHNDHVYHLGDVYFGKGYEVLYRLNGKKRLLVGNHDDPKSEHLLKHFEKIMLWRKFDDMILTHIPIHPTQFPGKTSYNLHGHIHGNVSPTPQHYNCCVEVQDYTPREITDIYKEIKHGK